MCLKSPKYLFGVLSAVVAVAAPCGTAAWAQTAQQELQQRQAPGNILDKYFELEDRQRFEDFFGKPPVNKLEGLEEDAPAGKSAGPTFLVNRIELTTSEVLSDEELASVTENYEGQRLTLSELRRIVDDFKALYDSKGFITSRAILPPQKIRGGVVRVQLIEGRIGGIILEDSQYTLDKYLMWALDIEEGEILSAREIEERLIFFNKTHHSVRVGARLSPGEEADTTDLNLRVAEAPRFSANLYVDNLGSTSTGIWRRGATFQNNSVVGFDDQIIAGLTATEGSLSGFISYDFPFTPNGTRTRLLYSRGSQDIVGGAFAELDIEGRSEFFSAELTQPIFVTKDWSIDLDAEYSRNYSESDVVGVLQENQVRKLVLGLNVARLDSQGAWLGDLHVHRIIGESSINDGPTTRDLFYKGTVNLTRYQTFSQGTTVVGRVAAQFTKDELLPVAEQFQLGGSNNVGYESSEFSGDNGYAVSLEVQRDLPLPRYLPEYMSNTNFVLYGQLQHGGSFPFRAGDDGIRREDFASSASIGLRANILSRGFIDLKVVQHLDGIHDDRARDTTVLFTGQISF